MKTNLFALPLLLLSAVSLNAQTHSFTFGPFTSLNSGCAEFQTLDGQPANQAAGYSGQVCFPYGENPWWGLEVPQVWGLPNNGFLMNNTTVPPLNPPVFTKLGCNLQTAGCVDYQTGQADIDGVLTDVTVWFVVSKHSRFGRGCYPCTWYTNDETNGSGTITN